MMSKLNQIISTTVSGGGGWEIPSIKRIIENNEELSDIGMKANTNYRLLVIPNLFALSQSSSGYGTCARVLTTSSGHIFYINNIQTTLHETNHCYLPLCVPFYFK